MAAALIGLIGIVAGALLGGLLTFGVEARKRRQSAYAAGTLIATELGVIINRLVSAIPESGDTERWEGTLPTTAWEAHAADIVADGIPALTPGKPEPLDSEIERLLAPSEPTGLSLVQAPVTPTASELAKAEAGPAEVPQAETTPSRARSDLLTRLGAVYASIDRWNTRKDAHPKRSDLVRDIRGYSAVQGDLKRYTRSLERRGRVSLRRLASVLTAIVVLLIAVLLLVTPRADVSSDTVAEALQSHLGSMDIVQCIPSGVDDWRCSDHHLSEPLSACQAAAAADRIAVSGIIVARVIQLQDCTETASPTRYNVVADGTQLVAIREDATDREMRMSASVAGMSDPSTSPWDRLVNWFRGRR
jgi:hypothetical protein